uniref:Uncharacterized protein n=1 Tax=Micrurus paraensis TaxID=1970185 RepID=A0A2D4L371_9SAUR
MTIYQKNTQKGSPRPRVAFPSHQWQQPGYLWISVVLQEAEFNLKLSVKVDGYKYTCEVPCVQAEQNCTYLWVERRPRRFLWGSHAFILSVNGRPRKYKVA